MHEKKREWIRIIVKMKYKYVIYHHKRDADDHLRTITKQILLFIRENCIHIFIERKKNIILVCMTPQKIENFIVINPARTINNSLDAINLYSYFI